jgi:hypothetical protein
MLNRFNALLVVVCCLTVLSSCKTKELLWVPTGDVLVNAYKTDNEKDGKRYLQILYENTGRDTVEQIKYELIKLHGTKADTDVRIIEPPQIFLPSQRHIVPRQTGQGPADFDAVTVGRVWVIKKGT